MNFLWFSLIIVGIIGGTMNGTLPEISEAIFQSGRESVQLTINLLGPMALWLGLINIAKQAGIIDHISKIIKPLFKYIFPDIYKNKKASGAILMNVTANLLGMGNSATPLGIKAMQELQKINNKKSQASRAMCTLLAINTSGITIIPATIISLRVALDSTSPSAITITTILATIVSTVTALTLDKTFRYFDL